MVNQMSDKERERQTLYRDKLYDDFNKNETQECRRCQLRCRIDDVLEGKFHRHHPNGRHDILDYMYLCHTCHRWVHDNPSESRRIGLLT